MPTVTIANQKGGTGKTTTTLSLAHGLAQQGAQVLIVDLDPQGQCALGLDVDPGPGVMDWLIRDRQLRDVVRPTGRNGLTLLPGDKTTSVAANMLLAEYRGAVPVDLISRRLPGGRRQQRDVYVLIDTSPSVSELQSLALYAADMIVIPARCDHWSQDSLAKTLSTIDLVSAHRPKPPAVAILPTFFDERATAARDALAAYRGAMPTATLDPIHAATRFADAAAAGKTIFEIEPAGRPATEYARLVWYVRDRNG